MLGYKFVVCFFQVFLIGELFEEFFFFGFFEILGKCICCYDVKCVQCGNGLGFDIFSRELWVYIQDFNLNVVLNINVVEFIILDQRLKYLIYIYNE